MTKPLSAYYWEKARQYHRARCKQCDNIAQRTIKRWESDLNAPITRERNWLRSKLGSPRPCAKCGTTHIRQTRTDYCSKTCADAARERNNPGRNKNKSHKRRTRTRYTDLGQNDIQAILSNSTICPLCQSAMTTAAGQLQKQIDHIIPINIGGTHTKGNIRIICRTCNLARPSDGSDLDGHQPTIWACDQVAAQAATVLKRNRERLPPRPNMRTLRRRSRKLARKIEADLAYLHRLHGLPWTDITERFGFSSSGHAHNVVYGGDHRAYAPARQRHFKPR